MAEQDGPWQFLAIPENFCKDLDSGIKDLVKSSLRSFAILEPWCQAVKRVDHYLVATMVNKLVGQASEYIIAIKMSVETAKKGCAFADDAIDLCNFIRNGEGSVDDLQAYVTDMLEIANTAYKCALSTNERFRAVRSELFQISRNIPSDVAKITEEQQGNADVHLHGVNAKFVAIPAPLPMHGRVSHLQENHRCELTETSFADAIARLEQAQQDLNGLVEHVGQFVDWWGSMKLKLVSLQTAILLIKPDGTNPLRRTAVHNRWVSVQEQYALYHSQISVIEDYYPALLLENGHKAVSVRRSEPEPVVLRVITDPTSAQETPDATDVFASIRSHFHRSDERHGTSGWRRFLHAIGIKRRDKPQRRPESTA